MFEDKIARGAALLDRQGPPNWIDHIDLAQLDLEKVTRCVLGQLYSKKQLGAGYTLGLRQLKLDDQGARLHGFATGETIGHLVRGVPNYELLTAEWREYIAKRRLARTAATAAPEPVPVPVPVAV